MPFCHGGDGETYWLSGATEGAIMSCKVGCLQAKNSTTKRDTTQMCFVWIKSKDDYSMSMIK